MNFTIAAEAMTEETFETLADAVISSSPPLHEASRREIEGIKQSRLASLQGEDKYNVSRIFDSADLIPPVLGMSLIEVLTKVKTLNPASILEQNLAQEEEGLAEDKRRTEWGYLSSPMRVDTPGGVDLSQPANFSFDAIRAERNASEPSVQIITHFLMIESLVLRQAILSDCERIGALRMDLDLSFRSA